MCGQLLATAERIEKRVQTECDILANLEKDTAAFAKVGPRSDSDTAAACALTRRRACAEPPAHLDGLLLMYALVSAPWSSHIW